MAHVMFPNGSPVHSTLFIKNGNFRAAGEIVAASLAQNGPPPSFLEEVTYKMLVNPDLDLMSLKAEQHLTPSEREQISRIREDVVDFQDIIIMIMAILAQLRRTKLMRLWGPYHNQHIKQATTLPW